MDIENDYKRFKSLLEYFVAHLEYIQTDSKDINGYDTYIKKLKDTKFFKKVGLGYANHNIQKQISEWSNYGNHVIHINISNNYGEYNTTKCYLNWDKTWLNIRPIWDESNTIKKLCITTEENSNANSELSFSLEDLGLFDKKEPNSNLKKLFDEYESLIIKHELKEYIHLLESNHNLILTGAPGTGKTYLAHRIAKELGATKENGQCEMVQFHPSYDYTDFVEGLRPTKDDKNGNIGFNREDGVFKEFCKKALKNYNDSNKTKEEIGFENQFKEAYNKFIEEITEKNIEEITLKSGIKCEMTYNNNKFHLKPDENEYSINYETLLNTSKDINFEKIDSFDNVQMKDINSGNNSYIWAVLKPIYEIYKSSDTLLENTNSQKIEKKNYIFIIDEINRGELSKIFGELFFSIDPGYRGKKGKINTQYQNLLKESGDEFEDGFYVPENVYIIGTMNDIDRSVESMDFAMRRRFAFKEIAAESRIEMLDEKIEDKSIVEEAKKRLSRLNKAIEEIEGLNSAYHIGPAYFLKIENYIDKGNDKWDLLWRYHIEGLLREYLRGYEVAEEKIKDLKNAYDNNNSQSENNENNGE